MIRVADPGVSNEYKAFVEQQYSGVPNGRTSLEQKEKSIQAKKNIMRHPECTNLEKVMLQKEIAIIKGEIAKMELDDIISARDAVNEKYNPPTDTFVPSKKD